MAGRPDCSHRSQTTLHFQLLCSRWAPQALTFAEQKHRNQPIVALRKAPQLRPRAHPAIRHKPTHAFHQGSTQIEQREGHSNCALSLGLVHMLSGPTSSTTWLLFVGQRQAPPVSEFLAAMEDAHPAPATFPASTPPRTRRPRRRCRSAAGRRRRQAARMPTARRPPARCAPAEQHEPVRQRQGCFSWQIRPLVALSFGHTKVTTSDSGLPPEGSPMERLCTGHDISPQCGMCSH